MEVDRNKINFYYQKKKQWLLIYFMTQNPFDNFISFFFSLKKIKGKIYKKIFRKKKRKDVHIVKKIKIIAFNLQSI